LQRCCMYLTHGDIEVHDDHESNPIAATVKLTLKRCLHVRAKPCMYCIPVIRTCTHV